MTDSANLIPAPIATAVLDHVVRSIVDNPDAVVVEGSNDGDKVLLEVRVGEGDLGRVIGRRGRTAMSIRTVVRAAATRDWSRGRRADDGWRIWRRLCRRHASGPRR